MDLVEAVVAAITEGNPPPPADSPAADVVRYGGGTAGAARVDVELPAGKLPAKGTDERRKYEAVKRKFQRWVKGETRRPPGEAVEALRRKIFNRPGSLVRRVGRQGANNRIEAWVVVPSPTAKGGADRRLRIMPAGASQPVYLSPSDMRQITGLLLNDPEAAAQVWIDKFLENYGFQEAEIEDVIRVRVWPARTSEPR